MKCLLVFFCPAGTKGFESDRHSSKYKTWNLCKSKSEIFLLSNFIKKMCGIYLWTGVSLVESGPVTPLPDKKLLLFILDRVQKYI